MIFKNIYVKLITLIDSGASGAIIGGSTNNFYEKNKGRTKEGKIKRTTVILMVLFFILSIGLGIIYV